MSCKYSIELREIVSDPLFKLFDFNYPFYTDDLKEKEEFEDLFIERFYFHEIGFETVARFKHQLKVRLKEVMPYYIQLHQTELRAQNIDFLLNKDLREEFIREAASDSSSNISTNSTSLIDSTNSTNSKVSSLDNGNASVKLSDGYLTGASSDSGTTSGSNKTEGGSQQANKINQQEKTVFISQGNIGVTSSAELLTKWRDCLINIRLDLLEEFNDLFMMIY